MTGYCDLKEQVLFSIPASSPNADIAFAFIVRFDLQFLASLKLRVES
jgi:hypothetical protein